MKKIGLIDCNNFFVSCERLFRPDLANKPVVVLSSNDGCVVSRSQEVKDNGVPMGAPYFQVKDILSHIGATVFSSHFTLYRDISRRVFTVVQREVGFIEQYSIDEAFFLLESERAEEVAWRVKRAVFREVGIPVSVGVGASKTQAKYANALAKRTQGVTVLDPSLWEERWPEIRLGDLWGVGRGRIDQFNRYGLCTVEDFLMLSCGQVKVLFGVEGERLWAELMGMGGKIDSSAGALQKTLASTRSFSEETTCKEDVRSALLYHLHQIVSGLENKEACATTLRIVVYPSRFGDFALQGISVEVSLPVPTRDIFTLTKQVSTLLDRYYRPAVPYKKAGIIVSVEPQLALSESLFPDIQATRTQALSRMLTEINCKHGRQSLTLGRVGQGNRARWRTRAEKRSLAYTTDWSSLCVVKAL